MDERENLVELLISSLDEDVGAGEAEEIEAAWVIEANRRLQEILKGNAETIPADEVMRKVLSRRAWAGAEERMDFGTTQWRSWK